MTSNKSTFAKFAAVASLTFAIAVVSIGKTHSDGNFSAVKISNFGQMDERFYRGARPKEKDFATLKALGIHTIIDLTDNTPEERGYVEAQGMRYVNIAIPDKKDPSAEQIAEFLKVVNDSETGKFYVHCAGGRHRTGVMGAIYRFNNYHWNLDQVYAEMLDFDFYTSNGHGGQKKFVENYAQQMLNSVDAATSTSDKH
ncbi:MAG TPA: tyrosine-protein phosphatase [Pyrinomonadaceae bacterium]|nr:tyrosine-protein phosphatase [Pyrinomonadaceae bacterium]